MVKIKLAKLCDLDRVKEIAEACAKKMIEDNIFQWNENYPSKEIFREDIKNNALFVARINSEIVGCIMLSSYKDDVYKNVKWISEDNNNLYIHRLAVHPRFQKKGIARKMMEYAEAFAKSKNHKSIRLDTFSKNHRNNKFYKLRGYIKLDDVFFPNQSVFPFHCYEKLID
jgi:ribosomal protein S18 acetylase RimI-like enzyme|tara:strand:+ start:258 stop:767 length:510 start_codon:yes stop_codon:yes gene_type:complete